MGFLPVFSPDSVIYHDRSLRNLLWHLHGILLAVSFLLLFPLGVVAIRSGSRFSLRYHYLLQLSATIFASTGIAVGIVISKGLSLWHQYLGFAIAAVLLVQPASGWRHHVIWKQVKRKTIWSSIHVWTGRINMGIAWLNILLGLILRHYHGLVQAAAGICIIGLVVLWMLSGLGLLVMNNKGVVTVLDEGDAKEGLITGDGNEFALDDLDEEEEADGSDENRPKTRS